MNRIISVYELLGLIKDGKAPKKIIFDTTEYKYGCGYYYRIDNEVPKIFTNEYNIFMCLNEEVEILEENKPIIEKLYIGKNDITYDDGAIDDDELVDNFIDVKDKLNEVIEFLNNKFNH